MWFDEAVSAEEIGFEAGVFLIRKVTAECLRMSASGGPASDPKSELGSGPKPDTEAGPASNPDSVAAPGTRTLRLTGNVPPEVWDRLGTKILPKLRNGTELRIGVDFSVTVPAEGASSLMMELRQVLKELDLGDAVRLE